MTAHNTYYARRKQRRACDYKHYFLFRESTGRIGSRHEIGYAKSEGGRRRSHDSPRQATRPPGGGAGFAGGDRGADGRRVQECRHPRRRRSVSVVAAGGCSVVIVVVIKWIEKKKTESWACARRRAIGRARTRNADRDAYKRRRRSDTILSRRARASSAERAIAVL